MMLEFYAGGAAASVSSPHSDYDTWELIDSTGIAYGIVGGGLELAAWCALFTIPLVGQYSMIITGI